jgi:eukaryotic-like serine/threonine-protein kinase
MELFHEACDLSGDARAALLQRVRGEDVELAVRLDGLLVADAAARDVSHTLPAKAAARRPLETIGGLRLGRLLGEGGMGAVYEAEQEHPRRRVAVKILHAGTPAMSRRFQIEVQTLARLAHPGIAAIHAAGEDQGRLYFVMELVAGEPLDRRAAALGPAERLAVLARLADAVHHAHQKGVIHRDLKPANVLVCGDRGDQPKVLDFGIARLLDADPGERATASGYLVGTPAYMSPEQADQGEIDARSDVYALGVIAYEVLAGRLPYPECRSLPEMLQAVRTHAVTPLSRVRPELAGDLEVVVGKALAADPEARYASAAAFADDLRRVLADEPVAARPPALATQIRRFARKNRALTVTALALLLAILGGGVTTTVLLIRADRARRQLLERNRELILARARAELDVDPTRAVATLAPIAGAAEAQDLARIAAGRGVALAVLTGHTTEVRSVSFSPDGRTLATAGYDHAVRLWDLAAGAARERPVPGERVAFAWYSAGGALLSGGPDGARTWNPDAVLDRAPADAAAWSPDGRTAAVVGRGRGVVLYRAGAAAVALAPPRGDVALVAWSPSGAWIAGGGLDGAVWAWPSAGGAAISVTSHPQEITELAFAADDVLLSGSRDGEVRRSTLVPGGGAGDSQILETAPHLKAIACGRRACAWGAHDGTVSMWDGQAVRHARGHDGPVRTIAFAPDGESFASGGDDHLVRLWDAGTGAQAPLRGHRARVRMVAWSPDGTRLASAANDGEVRVWDVDGSRRRLAHDGPVLSLAVAPDGALVVSGGSDGRLRALAIDAARGAFAAGEARIASTGFPEGVTDLAIAPGRILAAGRERAVKVWDLASGAVASWPAPARVVRVEVGGERAAAATLAGPIPVWDLGDGSLRLLAGHDQRVNDVRFLADGRLISGGDDRTVRAWDLATGAGTVLATCDDQVSLLAVARDGTIAAASIDGAVRLLPSGRVLRGHQGRVRALAFAPDGRLATGGHDGSVRVWNPATGSSARAALHDAPVTSLTWVGDVLVSAGDGGLAIAWTPAAGARVLGPARRVVATPGAPGAAAGGDDGFVRLWDPAAPSAAPPPPPRFIQARQP